MQTALMEFKAEIFHALAHPTRIAIVETLRAGELTAGQLIERLALEQANASQHLAILRKAGFVVTEREGKFVFYSVNHRRLKEVQQFSHTLLGQ